MNSILILQPYRCVGTRVFGDANTGLVQEPFVEDIPEMLNELTHEIYTKTEALTT